MTRAAAALVNAVAWLADRALATALCERLVTDWANATDEGEL